MHERTYEAVSARVQFAARPAADAVASEGTEGL